MQFVIYLLFQHKCHQKKKKKKERSPFALFSVRAAALRKLFVALSPSVGLPTFNSECTQDGKVFQKESTRKENSRSRELGKSVPKLPLPLTTVAFSGNPNVSMPRNVKHKVHVDFASDTGFTVTIVLACSTGR